MTRVNKPIRTRKELSHRKTLRSRQFSWSASVAEDDSRLSAIVHRLHITGTESRVSVEPQMTSLYYTYDRPSTLSLQPKLAHKSLSIDSNDSTYGTPIDGTFHPQVLLSGALKKRSSFFSHWTPRYVILNRHSLSYYRRNPFTTLVQTTTTDPEAAWEATHRRLVSREILRKDVIGVESMENEKKRPYSFQVIMKKPPHYNSPCIPSSGVSSLAHRVWFGHRHTSETNNEARHRKRINQNSTGQSDSMMYLLFQATSERERQQWIRGIQRWIKNDSRRGNSNIGPRVFNYVIHNEYAKRYERKRHMQESTRERRNSRADSSSSTNSPAAQVGKQIEERYPILANLMRDLHECQQEDEMVYILDQVLGEVKDGGSTIGIKQLISSAAESKVSESPHLWTSPVQAAYANIMKSIAAALAHPIGSKKPPLPTTQVKSFLRPPAAFQRQSSIDGEAAPVDSFHRYYKLGRTLGSGSFSVVHIATHRQTCKQVAVKCLSKSSLSPLDVLSMKQEVAILSSLEHPNVVPLLDYMEDNRYYYIVTPLCSGGELFDELVKRKSYTEDDARALMKKLASAMTYVHAKGIVHRDLKPENILLKTSAPGAEVIVADFGFARSVTTGTHAEITKRWTACGTPGYVAPEVVKGEVCGPEVDCWSLGVILFILLCGYPPFPGENHAAILDKVVVGAYEFDPKSWQKVSNEAKDLVRKLLTVDRKKRCTAAGILQHPWMTQEHFNDHGQAEDCGTQRSSNAESNGKNLSASNLLPVLNELRKHHFTHAEPKVRPSDMQVDTKTLALDLQSINGDADILDREFTAPNNAFSEF